MRPDVIVICCGRRSQLSLSHKYGLLPTLSFVLADSHNNTRISLPYYWPDCLNTMIFHLLCPMATMNCDGFGMLTASLWLLKCSGLWPQKPMVSLTGKIWFYEVQTGQLCMLCRKSYIGILLQLLKPSLYIGLYKCIHVLVLTIITIGAKKCRFVFCVTITPFSGQITWI